eukprot:2119655-Prymnesium_polylepis.1
MAAASQHRRVARSASVDRRIVLKVDAAAARRRARCERPQGQIVAAAVEGCRRAEQQPSVGGGDGRPFTV